MYLWVPTGIQSLLDWIAGYHLSLSKLLFCAENMGSYVTELSVSSVSMGFSLALVCPLTIKKSIGLQRGKNDRIDAKRIANYAVLHYRKLELYKLPDKDLVRLRGGINNGDGFVDAILFRARQSTKWRCGRQILLIR